jgi:hypothetical protein
MIRLRVDNIAADLAAERLRQDGVPAQVVSDSDLLAVAGVPMSFSVVVPSDMESKARKILEELGVSRRRR